MKLDKLLPDTGCQTLGGIVGVPIPYISTLLCGRAPEPIAATYVSVSLNAISIAPAPSPDAEADTFVQDVTAFDEYLIEHVEVVGLIA